MDLEAPLVSGLEHTLELGLVHVYLTLTCMISICRPVECCLTDCCRDHSSNSIQFFQLGSGTTYSDTTAFWRKIFSDMTAQEIIAHEKIGPIFLREIGYEESAENPSKIRRL